MMGVVTKLKVSATMASLIVVAALGFAFLGDGNARPEPQKLTPSASGDTYMLSVKWHPGVMPIHSEVHIMATVDGVALIERQRRLSPWQETLVAAPGAVVVLTARSKHQGTEYLDCIIMRNGRAVPHSGFDSRTNPGSVRCQA